MLRTKLPKKIRLQRELDNLIVRSNITLLNRANIAQIEEAAREQREHAPLVNLSSSSEDLSDTNTEESAATTSAQTSTAESERIPAGLTRQEYLDLVATLPPLEGEESNEKEDGESSSFDQPSTSTGP